MKAQIGSAYLNTFMSCLAIGTLYAMKHGALPFEAGISGMGHPTVWKPIEGMISEEVLHILQTADELDMMSRIPNYGVVRVIDEQIETLLRVLANEEHKGWSIYWLNTSDDEDLTWRERRERFDERFPQEEL